MDQTISQSDVVAPESVTPAAETAIGPKGNPALYCQWLWHAVTVLCDGTVTCGLDDPFKRRNYGSLKSATLREIFSSPSVLERRRKLQSGTPCHACAMHTSAAGIAPNDLKPSQPYPKRLILEPSIKCNIRCRNETCDIANDATFHLRREDFMPWALFCKLMDEAGPHLHQLYFYNYGEPFIHPKALDMLAYAKKVNPGISVTTSTNGILLARDGMAERIIAEGLVDWICFTIGGVDQDTYGRYHKAGSFEKAMLGMRRLAETKHRAQKKKPIIHWRYLLFRWNDSDECIEKALRLREEIGVDEFKFMLTASPMEGRSLLRAPGTPGYQAIRPWLAYQDDYCPDLYLEAGFWGPETSPRLGAFRWTGKLARVKVPVADGRINVRLAQTGDLMAPTQTAKLRAPWGDFDANIGAGIWGENQLAVPQDHRESQVIVEIEVDHIFCPFRHSDSADNRELGLMVSMEGLLPAPNPHRIADVPLVRATNLSR